MNSKSAQRSSRPGIADKRRLFKQLHESGCFLIPNPWDVGSAVYLQSLGFKALASTSSGLAWSLGRPDNALSRDQVICSLRELVAATDVPLNADFESGFGASPAEVADSVSLAVDTGVAGLSIEDSTGDEAAPLFDLDAAVQRLRAARAAIDRAGSETLLVARAECFLVGRSDLGETIDRLQAYAEAGADCLYAPGLPGATEIRAVVAAVAPKPVNVLVGSASRLSFQALTDMGVRRVSVGGALARVAWGGFMQAARLLAEQSSFDGFAGAPGHGDLDRLFV
jgi:2-methylisocitrate lyase-like PEP mutase family enzyme